MDFGKRLQKLRKHFGYTQQEIATMLNVSANAYGKNERSAKLPPAHYIDQLAAIYGLSPEVLNSDCELEYYTDAAGKPAVKERKKEPSFAFSLLRVAILAVAEYIERKEK